MRGAESIVSTAKFFLILEINSTTVTQRAVITTFNRMIRLVENKSYNYSVQKSILNKSRKL